MEGKAPNTDIASHPGEGFQGFGGLAGFGAKEPVSRAHSVTSISHVRWPYWCLSMCSEGTLYLHIPEPLTTSNPITDVSSTLLYLSSKLFSWHLEIW